MPRRKGSVKRVLGARLRLVLDEGSALGPGKADLLHRIVETGSIAAAGRSLAMSYRRAWMLIDELNRIFVTPLVVAAKGGKGGGGSAKLTPLGQEVLDRYRRMERATGKAIAADLKALCRLLARK